MPWQEPPNSGPHVRQLEDLLASALFDRSLACVDPKAAIALIECILALGEEERAAGVAGRLESLAATQPRSPELADAAATGRRLVDDATDYDTEAAVTEGLRPESVMPGRSPAESDQSGRGPHPTIGWASLTQTEHRITNLVAEGLTNRQVGKEIFVSRHTVDSHMRHIFRKLDISSRVQLTRMAAEHSTALTESLPPIA
jgi:DNA-binding CsgD family transcriptional regulator